MRAAAWRIYTAMNAYMHLLTACSTGTVAKLHRARKRTHWGLKTCAFGLEGLPRHMISRG